MPVPFIFKVGKVRLRVTHKPGSAEKAGAPRSRAASLTSHPASAGPGEKEALIGKGSSRSEGPCSASPYCVVAEVQPHTGAVGRDRDEL